jgi:pimeloyl-ACP methyl ester carboxylesterase
MHSMKRKLTGIILWAALSGALSFAVRAQESVPAVTATESRWHGYLRHDFTFQEREGILVIPEQAAEGKPWIWRPAFFGHGPQVDLALLEKGWHVAYYDVTNLYGSPRAVALGYDFYRLVTERYGLSGQTVPEGFSRGGLFAFNWAAAFPDRVACIYADAPVCDFKSWPAAGQPDHPSEAWRDCLREYGLTAQEAWAYTGNPVDNLAPLAQAGIPVIAVCGEADEVVPYAENAGRIRQRYAALGGHAHVILKPGVKHHPHSLENPEPVVDFLLHHTAAYREKMDIRRRGSLSNCRIKFAREKKGRVAFMGGSITEMSGWREMVCRELQMRFPDTEFEFINAGISSTGTTPGAFRFSRDVLCSGPVDLLFEEAAVNDETNGFGPVEQIRGMEGVIRQARLSSPDMDIVMLHFIWDGMLEPLSRGVTPEVIRNHERVAEYYRIPSIHLAGEVSRRMRDGEFDWETFGGTHPAPFGHKIYAAAISRLFDEMWHFPLESLGEVQPHVLPTHPLDPCSYYGGKLVDIRRARPEKGWKYIPDWQPQIKAGTRKGFVHVPALEALAAGARLRFTFTGRTVGIFHVAGPDAGVIEYSVDGKPFQEKDLFTEWSAGLYLPWLTVLETCPDDGPHELTLRMTRKRHPDGKGHACRILFFAVDGEN